MRYLLFLTFFFSLNLVAPAQDGDLKLDEDSWQKMVNGIDYDEDKEEPEEEKPEKKKEDTEVSNRNWDIDSDFWRPIFFGIIIVVVLIVIFQIVKNFKTDSAVGKNRIEAKSLEEAEENLPDVMLNNIYSQALEGSDFKSAFRIRFLMILQQMIDQKMIIWKKRKTNEQFLREIVDQQIYMAFASIVDVFDASWYGNHTISKEEFDSVIGEIDRLNNQIHVEE